MIFYAVVVILSLNYWAYASAHLHADHYGGMNQCFCEPGPPGPRGRDGIKGFKGVKGDQGFVGIKGNIGFTGPQGFTGILVIGDEAFDISPVGLRGPPGFDTQCPPECISGGQQYFYKRSLATYEPYTIYKVSMEGEMVPVKKLKPTPALHSLIKHFKDENVKNQDDIGDEY